MELHVEKLKNIRKRKKITAEELANKLGITRVTIGAWENRKRIPSESKIRRLAKALNVSVSEISDLDDDYEISKIKLAPLASSISSLLSTDEQRILNCQKNLVLGITDIIKELSDANVIIKAILSFLPSLFYIKGSDLKYVTASDRFLKKISMNKKFNIIGKTDFDLFSKKEAMINSEMDKEVLTSGKSISNIETYMPGTRKTKWGIMSKIPIVDFEGKIEGILGFFDDITERRKMERQIQQEEEFKHTLLDNLPVGIVACDKQGILALLNKVASIWHGINAINIPPEEWAAHYNLYKTDGITPLPLAEIPLFRAFNEESFEQAEMTIVTKGEIRHIIANGAPFYDKDMNKLGAVVSMTDVTELKENEKKLNEYQIKLQTANKQLRLHQLELETQNDDIRIMHSELNSEMKHYSDLYNIVPVSLFTLNKQCHILEANLTSSNLLGIDIDHLIKQTFTSFIFPEDQDIFYLKYRDLWKKGIPQKGAMRMIYHDGSLLKVYLQATLSSKDNCMVALMDIA